MSHLWPWIALALLGAYHGLNPAMGWLFALSIGLQERRRSAVIGALFPIALGHALAIMVAILLLRFAQHFIPLTVLKPAVALVLFALGGYRILRASHPRGSGLRVGGNDLFVWSFLMASAHGAGLMLLPILMSQPMVAMSHPMTAHSMPGGMPVTPGSWNVPVAGVAVLLHTASMLTVAGILALLFFATYERMGLRLLRHAWLNFDLLWAIALLLAGLSVLFL
jgi:hypothetical protein